MLPPRWLRRILLAPVAFAITAIALVTLPVAAIVAAIASRFVPGRWRPVRLLWFAVNYLAIEAAVLLAAFALWVASGFGWAIRSERFVAAHYRLLAWALGRIVRVGQRTFNVRIEVKESGRRTEHAPRIVLSRHAGPGDSFLLVHEVCARGRRPRIVLKDTFQWEPMVDTLLGRLPCQFVSPNPKPGKGKQSLEGISELASGLTERDTLIIFPEGGNITAARRLRSITKLEEAGHHEEAQRARGMRHVMAPRPGGALAALEACPEAEVVFVAHTGLEDLSSAVDLWRGLPMDAAVRAFSSYVPSDEIPETREERIAWLYAWWKRVDTWIDDTRAEAWSL